MKYLLLMILIGAFQKFSIAQSDAELIRSDLVKNWRLAKELTSEYLQKMPAEKYAFKPHDSVRSFAEQMLNLAQVTSAMVSHGTGIPRLFEKGKLLEIREGSRTKDSVIHYVTLSYDYVIRSIIEMDTKKFAEKVTERNMEESRLNWILKAFDHQTHHRGQTTIYLRLAGIKPPVWRE